MDRFIKLALWIVIASVCAFAQAEARILDLKHYSTVFGEERNYRVFLPPDYETSAPERYPVIYFFHGWSERYYKPPRGNSGYDSGDAYGGDNIARFVGAHKVIVVKWDGYNPRTPGEDYPRPYNISPVETYRQFPLYFPELVAHIDATFRTIADRDHRATAGLSMGGFMSFWVSGKYPHLVGSASNFMGSSEFYAGPKDFPTEYRHTEMYPNYEGMRTRLVTGSRDFIRWYHERMNAIWRTARTHYETEQFDWDHGTPGMARTLAFHMNAFQDPLPRPLLWHHVEVYPEFDVWGYSVRTNRRTPGFTLLQNVSKKGFRSSVQEWLPNGRILADTGVQITTDTLYKPDTDYRITDVHMTSGAAKQFVSRSDKDGRLHFEIDGAVHEIGISEAAEPIPALASWRLTSGPWATSGSRFRLKLVLLNKGASAAKPFRGKLVSRTPGVLVRNERFQAPGAAAGKTSETPEFIVELNAEEREIVRLALRLNDLELPFEIPIYPKVEEDSSLVLLDGSKAAAWERAVHQAEKTLGAGNGDGKAQAGEKVVIAARDGGALRLAEILTPHPCVDLSERISDPWGAYDHVGATAKYTVAKLSPGCEAGTRAPLLVEYQLPNQPVHTLKRAIFMLSISGK
ncbi:MAG: hypothetical protein IT169_15820 [Bryobacterales bacterium]|nr:hypothetical protein [Bryobacterales bacterium]